MKIEGVGRNDASYPNPPFLVFALRMLIFGARGLSDSGGYCLILSPSVPNDGILMLDDMLLTFISCRVV